MAIKYGKIELPEKIKMEEINGDPNKVKFVAEPFERGYGYTVGNALRRIMLTSLESPSIISVKIEGVSHEYTAIDGIIEDMTHIVLNLKEALLRFLPHDEETYSKDNKIVSTTLEITQDKIDECDGNYKVLLKDIVGPSNFEVVNPEHYICTVTKPLSKRVDLKVGIGRGYVPSEKQIGFEKVIDEIIIDSCFSPVRKINYFVENTRVGQDTDYDRLILEVHTDGRISPKEALNFATQIGIKQFEVFDELKIHDISFDEGEVEINKEKEEILHKLALKIGEIELSVRSTNCLVKANIDTIGELVVMPESDMLKFRNFGKKSLVEIKQKLYDMGLGLGMDLSKYGINKDNIHEVIEKYLQEGQGE
jgi:DNA-directed RNA polymerase subunit alpha